MSESSLPSSVTTSSVKPTAVPVRSYDLLFRSAKPGGLALTDERANQITHGMGFLLTLIAAPLIVSRGLASGRIDFAIACAIYAISLCGLYLASTLSHSFTEERRRNRFRMWDQVAIFGLIAGNFTPYAVSELSGDWRIGLLPIIWVMAACGSAMRIRLGEQTLAFGLYIVMACLPLLTLDRIFLAGGLSGVLLVVGGGAAYATGLWFLLNDDRHPKFHAIWHVGTILGGGCHFLFVYRYSALG